MRPCHTFFAWKLSHNRNLPYLSRFAVFLFATIVKQIGSNAASNASNATFEASSVEFSASNTAFEAFSVTIYAWDATFEALPATFHA